MRRCNLFFFSFFPLLPACLSWPTPPRHYYRGRFFLTNSIYLGTTWAYIQQYILGVSEGHTAVLRLVGVGYRAFIEERPRKAEFEGQKFVCLKLGFTHPVEEPVPRGMKVSTPQPTRILVEGIDREQVMSLAARIRRWRRPEPYKGKGIFVNDETIKLKQKKIK